MGPVLSHTAACGAGSLGVMGGPGSPLSTTTLPTSFSTLLLLTNLICFFFFRDLELQLCCWSWVDGQVARLLTIRGGARLCKTCLLLLHSESFEVMMETESDTRRAGTMVPGG